MNKKYSKRSEYLRTRSENVQINRLGNRSKNITKRNNISTRVYKSRFEHCRRQKKEINKSAEAYARILEHEDIGINKAIDILKALTK